MAQRGRVGNTQFGHSVEARVCKKMGGKPMPASGALSGAKGDFILGDEFLVEHKATMSASFPVKYGVLNKIAAEAYGADREPLFAVSFCKRDSQIRPLGTWVAIPMDLFNEMYEVWEKRG